jgi:ubiquinone/menaquinone biosynthesis C-methylase UbiE
MGLLARPFAATYDWLGRSSERAWLGKARRELLAGLQGHVLELGAGTGANFPYYPPRISVVATEPSPHMIRRAAAKAIAKAALDPVLIELRRADAQALPFADGAFDAVVATLVFCTIPAPVKALAEVRRVAKPGAPLLMIEHVHAKTPINRLLLDLWSPVQQVLGAGCHPNRETVQTVGSAGFHLEEVRELVREFGLVPFVLIRARVPGGR